MRVTNRYSNSQERLADNLALFFVGMQSDAASVVLVMPCP
jgi:hypothetical protein